MEETLTAYLAPQGLEQLVKAEIGATTAEYERLLVKSGVAPRSYWSQNIWHAARYLKISSIKDAVKQLTTIQRNWCLYPYKYHRRAGLIADGLPYVGKKPLSFPSKAPAGRLGSWTLVEENLILAAPLSSSPFPNGEAIFLEDKVGPPSRAYLKLWEAFALAGRWPSPGAHCLDLGACPGGWTWVLHQLGAEVTAVDRSPLAPDLQEARGIHFRQGNAFTVKPEDLPPVGWLVCDVICYPEKLFSYLQTWLESGRCQNYVCTLKFQGDEHYNIIEKFAAIPGSRLVHLFNNKHELTWIKVSD